MDPTPICRPFGRGGPGRRIRLDVSSSNVPRFDVNPNTGAPEGRPGPRRIARNTVFMDGRRPSHVVLPVIPAGKA
ncbi:MAG TPA: CocE/NonD family hydrolase C-terminal non-catalytic domain-containing protein [Phenylobacterium sp.]|nr:CocE/NonD family hydrolase C-terminal non-catalytic domain-containing protein [Phenylobacterium sp.]